MPERLTIPLGTQVITRVAVLDAAGTVRYPVGAVATLIAAPAADDDRYTVRFVDGGVAALHRAALTIAKTLSAPVLWRLPAPPTSGHTRSTAA